MDSEVDGLSHCCQGLHHSWTSSCYKMLVRILVVLATLGVSADARSDGAPLVACISMTPQHGNSVTQTSAPPFRLTVETDSARKDGTVTVTLSTTDSGNFKGFIVQARCTKCGKGDTDIVDGTFTPSDDLARTMNCDGATRNSITHVSPVDKSRIIFDWTPPKDAPKSITDGIEFRATVVRTGFEWWSGIKSPEFRVVSGGVSRTSATVLTTVFLATLASLLL